MSFISDEFYCTMCFKFMFVRLVCVKPLKVVKVLVLVKVVE